MVENFRNWHRKQTFYSRVEIAYMISLRNQRVNSNIHIRDVETFYINVENTLQSCKTYRDFREVTVQKILHMEYTISLLLYKREKLEHLQR